MTNDTITSTEANSLLRYEPNTGYLYWRGNRCNIKAGDKAGHQDQLGYIVIRINYKLYKAHRIIWLMIYGEFPPHDIDHINRVRHDNRIKNIRAVTRQVNTRNMPVRSDNKSGVMGVHWCKRDKRWIVQIPSDNKRHILGSFKDWFDAVCARKSAEIKYGFHPNHGKRLPGAGC